MPLELDLRPASLRLGGINLMTPLSRLAGMDEVFYAIIPSVGAEEARLCLDLAGAAWLVIVAGGAATLYSDRPFPARLIDRLDFPRLPDHHPRVSRLLGVVAVGSIFLFTSQFGKDGILADASESLTR